MALNKVGEFIRGNGLQKSDLLDEGRPAVHYGQIHTKYGLWFDRSVSYVAPDLWDRLRHASTGDLIVATTSENDDDVGKATAWLGNGDIAVGGDAFVYRHELDPKYMSLFFQSDHFHRQKKRYLTGTKIRRISGADLGKIEISVPDTKTQRAVAKSLDAFNDLISNISVGLPAEIKARRQQYEYYRDKLLAFQEKR